MPPPFIEAGSGGPIARPVPVSMMKLPISARPGTVAMVVPPTVAVGTALPPDDHPARGSPTVGHDLRAAIQIRRGRQAAWNLVGPPLGFEPRTCGLRVRCRASTEIVAVL